MVIWIYRCWTKTSFLVLTERNRQYAPMFYLYLYISFSVLIFIKPIIFHVARPSPCLNCDVISLWHFLRDFLTWRLRKFKKKKRRHEEVGSPKILRIYPDFGTWEIFGIMVFHVPVICDIIVLLESCSSWREKEREKGIERKRETERDGENSSTG